MAADIESWVARIRQAQRDTQPFSGQQSAQRDAQLNMAWVRVVSASADAVTVSPLGDADRVLTVDGWITPADPNIATSTFVQIGGPVLGPGDIALVMIYGGYILAIGVRRPFVRIDGSGEAVRIGLAAVPTANGARLTWGIAPAQAGVTWSLFVDDESAPRLSDSTRTSYIVTGQLPGSVHDATVYAFDSDGEQIGSAYAGWRVLGSLEPTLSLAVRSADASSITIAYSATAGASPITAWRLYADDAQVRSGTGNRPTATYRHSGLTAGSEHTYRLEADYLDSDDVTQTETAEITAKALTQGISSFTATVDDLDVDLAWATRNCTMLQVQRKAGGADDSTYTTIHTPSSQSARNAGTHTDTPGVGSWTYRVVCGDETATADATVLDDTVPPTVSISAAGDSAALTVSGTFSATGVLTAWRLYRDNARHQSGSTPQPAGSFTHTGLTAGSTHTYRIEADYRDKSNVLHTVRDQVQVTLGEPSIDTFTAEADGGDVNLAWETTNIGSAGVIHRKEEDADDSTYTQVTTVSAADIAAGTHTDVPGEGSWTYRLTAANLTATASVTVETDTEPIVIIIAARIIFGLLTVSWTVTGGGITSQTVTVSDGVPPPDGFAHTESVAPGTTEASVSVPNARGTYTITVEATNAAGTASDSITVRGTVPTPPTPQFVRCDDETRDSLTVEWFRPSGDNIVTSLRWRRVGQAIWGAWTVADTAVSHTVTQLLSNTSYEFEVRHSHPERVGQPNPIDPAFHSASVVIICQTTTLLPQPTLTITPRDAEHFFGSVGGSSGVRVVFDASWTEPTTPPITSRTLQIRRQLGTPAWVTVADDRIFDGTTPADSTDPPPWRIQGDPSAAAPWRPGDLVEARVRYVTASGQSPWSDVVMFRHGSYRLPTPAVAAAYRGGSIPTVEYTVDGDPDVEGFRTLPIRYYRDTEVRTAGPDLVATQHINLITNDMVIVQYPGAGTHSARAVNRASTAGGGITSAASPAATVIVTPDLSPLRTPPMFSATGSGLARRTAGTQHIYASTVRFAVQGRPAGVRGVEISTATLLLDNRVLPAAYFTGYFSGSLIQMLQAAMTSDAAAMAIAFDRTPTSVIRNPQRSAATPGSAGLSGPLRAGLRPVNIAPNHSAYSAAESRSNTFFFPDSQAAAGTDAADLMNSLIGGRSVGSFSSETSRSFLVSATNQSINTDFPFDMFTIAQNAAATANGLITVRAVAMRWYLDSGGTRYYSPPTLRLFGPDVANSRRPSIGTGLEIFPAFVVGRL